MSHFPCCPNIVLSVGYAIRGETLVYISPEIVAVALIGLLICACILLIILFIGVVDAKGHDVASWQLWFIGIMFTPLAVALYAAILPDRGGDVAAPNSRGAEQGSMASGCDSSTEAFSNQFFDGN